jgi:hypothetical protein
LTAGGGHDTVPPKLNRRYREGRETSMATPIGTGVATPLDQALLDTGAAKRVTHFVLESDWPIALCGASVPEHRGTGAPATDRYRECLRIAVARGLGRPGWASRA